ncbi:MAG: imidazolonepropionase [Bradymonadaceae bacterium]
MDVDTFAIHADQLLTMPDEAERLSAYDPEGDIEARDREVTGLMEDGGIFVLDGQIEWVGQWDDRPEAAREEDVAQIEVGVVTPGWIDCHTHAVFAGERSDEFVMRNAGRSYVEIMESGGGILNTVESVRQQSIDDLADALFARVFESVRLGVTTLEVKSGYGLTTTDELKLLKAVRQVEQRGVPCELVPCFLGAHAIPDSYEDRRDEYVDLVCNEMIPRVAEQNLADYCDVFCDTGAFEVGEAERILLAGRNNGMTPRIHADELSDAGASMLAAEIGAASADHLEYASDQSLHAMAEADVTAVLMPAVNLYLDTLDHLAPARKALAEGCEVALATDFNPGSAMTQDLGLMIHLGCTLYKLTPGEALRAVTLGAADALERDDIGRIREGQTADLTLLDVPDYKYIPYHAGKNHVAGVIQNGQIAYWSDVE